MTNFIDDFVIYNKGNECPRSYITWAAYAVLSTICGPRFLLNFGQLNILPDLMICLVGSSGNRKSFALTQATKLLRSVAPDVITCADQETPQGITKFMMKDEQVRVCIDYAGKKTTYRPYACFASELANWFMLNPEAMATFLTDISDKYTEGYLYRIKDEAHVVPHPYFTMLSCTVPELLTNKIKGAEFSSGFGRRIIFVCNDEMIMKKPELDQESLDAFARCQERLKTIIQLHGQFKLNQATDEWFWTKWYPLRKPPNDQFLVAQFRTEHIFILRLAMLTSLAYKTELEITFNDLRRAIALWYENKRHMHLLTDFLGRSELMDVDKFVKAQFEKNNNRISERHLLKLTFSFFKHGEQEEYFKFLQKSGKVNMIFEGKELIYIYTPESENADATPNMPEM